LVGRAFGRGGRPLIEFEIQLLIVMRRVQLRRPKLHGKSVPILRQGLTRSAGESSGNRAHFFARAKNADAPKQTKIFEITRTHPKGAKLARPKRFELLTPRFVVWCSIQLSYGRARR
jgi:hypothetical protein